MKKQTIACWKYLEPRLTKLVLFPEKTKYMNQYLQLTNFQNDIKKNILKAVGWLNTAVVGPPFGTP